MINNQDISIEKLKHNQLPTQEEIDRDSNLFLSDHRYIPATIPLATEGRQLKIISWNIYGCGPCGYKLDEIHKKLPGMNEFITNINNINTNLNKAEDVDKRKELKEEIKKAQTKQSEIISQYDKDRFKKQALLLKDMDVDVLLIQEASTESCDVFKEHLGENWECVTMRKNGTVMSFYRKDRYSLDGSITYPPLNEEGNTTNESIKDLQSFTLKSINNEQENEPPLNITNLWGQHHCDSFFHIRAQNINEFLSAKHGNKGTNIVGGDLNIPVGLCDDNDPTTITSRNLEFKNDCIDAIMYKPEEGNVVLCQSRTVKYTYPKSSEENHNIFIPEQFDQRIREEIISKIDNQIRKIKSPQFFLFTWLFFRDGSQKINALENLKNRINKATPGCPLNKIISNWEKEKLTNNTENYRDILHKHRFGREQHNSLTSSEKMIDDIKNMESHHTPIK